MDLNEREYDVRRHDRRTVCQGPVGGDQAAFEALVAGTRQRLARGIAGLLATQGGRRPDAKDVLQETYLRTFQALPKIEWQGAAHFDRWLGVIAKNLIFGAAADRHGTRLE